MDKGKRIFFSLLLAIVLTFVFSAADNQFLAPAIFAVTFSLAVFFAGFRKYLLPLSFGLLFLMLVFYFANQLETANWFASLGFGCLLLVVLSYLPQLVKQGHIDRY